jgi:hypothetical protein
MVMSFDSVVLLVMTDGRRDCIERTLASAAENLHGPIRRRVIHDDSGDGEYAAWLRHRFPGFSVISDPHGRQGFGGAINSAWAKVGHGQESYVFHLEDDFVFQRPVSLEPMMTILGTHPYLVQLALRRQPWNDEERTAGGIVEQYPADYADKGCCDDHQWLEHRRCIAGRSAISAGRSAMKAKADSARASPRTPMFASGSGAHVTAASGSSTSATNESGSATDEGVPRCRRT